jgi:predicted DNA-binding transcriptional regulator YafY
MARSDRLFDLIGILRDGRLYRAQDLADRLEVSVRTIYRDMDTLIASGIPIAGERGLGYMATAAITLPPLNLTAAELDALTLGMAIVAEAADPQMAQAARSLTAKVQAVLPEGTRAGAQALPLAVYPLAEAAKGYQFMPLVRAAIRTRQKLALTYRSGTEDETRRTIRPLQIEFWGRVWTATAWCELREDFRVFRLDRIVAAEPLAQLFVDEPGKTLEDYQRQHPEHGPRG